MRLLTVAVLCLCLTVAAQAQALGKRELAREANAICKQYTKKLNRIPQQPEDAYLGKVAAVAAEQQELLEDLRATGKARKVYATFLARYADATQILADIAAAYDADDAPELKRLTKALSKATRRLDKAADRLGAPACGK